MNLTRRPGPVANLIGTATRTAGESADAALALRYAAGDFSRVVPTIERTANLAQVAIVAVGIAAALYIGNQLGAMLREAFA